MLYSFNDYCNTNFPSLQLIQCPDTVKMDTNPTYEVSTSGTVRTMVKDDPANQTMSGRAGSGQYVDNPSYGVSSINLLQLLC